MNVRMEFGQTLGVRWDQILADGGKKCIIYAKTQANVLCVGDWVNFCGMKALFEF